MLLVWFQMFALFSAIWMHVVLGANDKRPWFPWFAAFTLALAFLRAWLKVKR